MFSQSLKHSEYKNIVEHRGDDPRELYVYLILFRICLAPSPNTLVWRWGNVQLGVIQLWIHNETFEIHFSNTSLYISKRKHRNRHQEDKLSKGNHKEFTCYSNLLWNIVSKQIVFFFLLHSIVFDCLWKSILIEIQQKSHIPTVRKKFFVKTKQNEKLQKTHRERQKTLIVIRLR